jgi:hypothetical protein
VRYFNRFQQFLLTRNHSASLHCAGVCRELNGTSVRKIDANVVPRCGLPLSRILPFELHAPPDRASWLHRCDIPDGDGDKVAVIAQAPLASFAEEDGDVESDGRVNFTVELYDTPCESFAVGGSSYFS